VEQSIIVVAACFRCGDKLLRMNKVFLSWAEVAWFLQGKLREALAEGGDC
jgi:hypothetical protein